MTMLCCWVSYDMMWYPRSAGRPRTFDRLLACIQLDWFTIISFHFIFSSSSDFGFVLLFRPLSSALASIVRFLGCLTRCSVI